MVLKLINSHYPKLKTNENTMEDLKDIIFEQIDNEQGKSFTIENNGEKIFLIIILLLIFAFGHCSRFSVLIQRVCRYYYTRKIFSKNNFPKIPKSNYPIDIDVLLQSVNKLENKQRRFVFDWLKESVPELNTQLMEEKRNKDFKTAVKNLSYNGRTQFRQCMSKIDFLMKIYRLECLFVNLKFNNKHYRPTNDLLADVIDILDFIPDKDRALVELKEDLIKFTSSGDFAQTDLNERLFKMWNDEHFTKFIDNFTAAEKPIFKSMQMPEKFDNSKLKKLYCELVKKGCLLPDNEDVFINIFNEGISENLYVVWKSKNRYEFVYFIFALYKTSFKKISDEIKTMIPQIFKDKNGKPLKVYNKGQGDDKRFREDFKKMVEELVEKYRND